MHNVRAVLRRCSTAGDVQYTGNVMSTLGGVQYTWGDIMSTPRDIMINVGEGHWKNN